MDRSDKLKFLTQKFNTWEAEEKLHILRIQEIPQNKIKKHVKDWK